MADAHGRGNAVSNWSLATAMSAHDRQLIEATLQMAYETVRNEGREATADEIIESLTGREPPRHAPRLD
jgi:hypothetical protein